MVRLINNNCVDFIVGDCRGPVFRTAFMSIGGLRALTDAPFMALSASAPPSIMKIIEESLQLKSPVHIRHSLDRPNVFLSCAKSKSLAVSYRLCFGLLGVVLHYCLHPKRDLASVTKVHDHRWQQPFIHCRACGRGRGSGSLRAHIQAML